MELDENDSVTSMEFAATKVLENLGDPKRVGYHSLNSGSVPSLDHRIDPEDLRLPGLVSEEEWAIAEKLTTKTETEVFGVKLSPLNKALLFRTIYVQLLQMQLKPN